MRMLKLALLGLLELVVLSAGLVAALPGTSPAVQFGPAVSTSTQTFERPRIVRLPTRPAAAAPVAAPVAVQPPVTAAIRHLRLPVRRPTTPAPVGAGASQPVVDGYPYVTSAGNAQDAWGFTARQCVSYVAWRLAVVGRAISNDQDGWGSASGWDDAARRLGIPVDGRASLGAIAQWEAGESSRVWTGSSTGTFAAGSYGHVGYVTQMFSDGSVQVAQYNATGDRAFSSMRMTAPRFLHVS